MDRIERALGELRTEYAPDLDAEHRVRERIAVSLALSAAGLAAGGGKAAASGSTLLTGASAAKSASAVGGLAGTFKLVATASLLGGIGWVGVHLGPSTEPPARAGDSLATKPTAVAPTARVSAPRPVSASGDREAAVPARELHAQGVPVPTSKPRAEPTSAPSAATKESPPGRLGTGVDELRLLRDASRLLRERQWAAAEEILETHRTRYPESVLGRERAGLSLLARCARGDAASVRVQVESFVAATPHLPITEALERQCLE